jgi:hypothetical protein
MEQSVPGVYALMAQALPQEKFRIIQTGTGLVLKVAYQYLRYFSERVKEILTRAIGGHTLVVSELVG